jgi:hypothetical protein
VKFIDAKDQEMMKQQAVHFFSQRSESKNSRVNSVDAVVAQVLGSKASTHVVDGISSIGSRSLPHCDVRLESSLAFKKSNGAS